MNLEARLEIYRVAFESAKSEVIEISGEFDKLRTRKEQIEKLVAVLKPLVGEGELAGDQSPAEDSTRRQVEPVGEASGEVRGEAQAVISDPFQRRIDHVLGIGAGIRDVRKYSRQF
jgi:hypothetical protein